MNQYIITYLGGEIAASLLTAPLAQAGENPFALQHVTSATQLAEMEKGADGKCGDKMKEGGCNGTMEKAKEGECNLDI